MRKGEKSHKNQRNTNKKRFGNNTEILVLIDSPAPGSDRGTDGVKPMLLTAK
jgi:hypothetical protein